MTNPMCDRLLVGICGSIGAVNIHTYLTEFRQSFTGELYVIMTEPATQIINPKVVAKFTNGPVFTGLWDQHSGINIPHIELAKWAQVFLVAPASYHSIGQAAHGLASDLLTTTIAAFRGPIIFAPSMNETMFHNAAFQRNIKQLRNDGHIVLNPGEGTSVSTGETSVGVMPTTTEMLRVMRHIHLKNLREGYWDEATRFKPRTPALVQLMKTQGVELISAD